MYKGVYITRKCFPDENHVGGVYFQAFQQTIAVYGTLVELGSCLLLALMTHFYVPLMTHVYGSIKVRH